MKNASIIAIVAVIAAGPLWISATSAQDYGAQQQQQQTSFSDTDLKSYAQAAQEVRQIGEEYRPQMEAADSPQAQQAIRQQATQKMIKVIEEEGLSVQQYNQIASAAREDPEIADKINQYMR